MKSFIYIKKYILPIVFVLTTSEFFPAFSQDSVSVKDSQEIQLLARRKVEKGLNDLLNTIAFEDLGDFERKALQTDSYNNAVNKVFYNDKIIVEDDINPGHTSKATGTDLTIERYLGDFDLFYPKSIDHTVTFSDFSVSNLKKSDYYYVKVYFSSHFKLEHNQIKKPYLPLKRVAEVRAEKKGKKWAAYITSIAFAPVEVPVEDTVNDVVLMQNATGGENLTASADVVSEAELSRNKEREAERQALEKYNNWLTEGDKAFLVKDYDKALEAYTEAEKRNDFDDLLPRRKIYQVKRAFEKQKQTQVELLREYLAKASIAQKTRNYSEAIGYYKKAYELKPDSSILGETIKQLNLKASVKTELDEKYNLGKYGEVIKDYTRILKKEKDNSDYYLGRGLAYVMTGEQDRAQKDFTQAIELDFANLAALKARAELFASKNDFPKAAADLTSYLNIDNTAGDILVRRARFRILTRNTNGAFQDYNRAIDLFPKNASYFFNRGILFFQTDDFSSAAADFSATVGLDNKFAEAYYNRGLTNIKLNKVQAAGEDFAQLRKLLITDEQKQQIAKIAAVYFDKAFNELNAKKYQLSVQTFEEVLSIKPDIAEAWFHRAKGLTMLQDTLGAIESLDMALNHRPDYSEAFYGRGDLWYNLEKFEKAALDYHRAYELNAFNYLANVGEGNAFFAQKLYDKAILSYTFVKVNEKKIGQFLTDSVFAAMYNKLGLSYLRTQQLEKALEELDKAITRDDKFSDAYFNRGQAYESAGSQRRATTDFRKAVGLDSGNPYKYLILGDSFFKEENFKDAIQAYSEAIEHDSKATCCKAIALVKRGDCHFNLKHYANAIPDYMAGFAADSAVQAPEALYNAGIAFLQQKQPDQAIKFLSAISSKDKLKGQCYFGIGCAYLQQKKQDEAMKWFEKSFQTGLLTKSYIRKDRLVESIDKSFANSSAFKELVSRNVIK